MGNSQGAVLPGAVPEPVKCEKFKILLLGPPNVGKSCIFKRYVSMRFEQLYQPDLTANIGSKLVGIDGLPTINLELWDIPGALDPNLEDIYFEGADGVILVFDVANAKQSTADVEVWFDRIRQYEARIADKAAAEKSSKKPLPPLPKLKFGNKRDLIHDVKWHHFDTSKAPPRHDRHVKFESFLTCPSFTVSAKDFGGMHAAFKQLIAEVYNCKHPLKSKPSATSTPRD
eukprot:INCI9313.1.p1 GENE.INCI9313.1~~INCI9313.1.p1  ORF type:complete len:229 (-),score=35.67 INCI9313.1:161-847(-)